MNQQESADWLFENGGPAIRYRTATELMLSSSNIDIGQLREELLQSQLVRTWLERLTPGRGISSIRINSLRGGKSTSFENVMGKLTDLGYRQGMAELDQRTMPFRQWLQDNAERPSRYIFDIFCRTLTAAFLARAGYTDEPAVGIVLKNRLKTIYDFTRQGSYDIYVDPAYYSPRMPRSLHRHSLISPALSRDGNLSLPWIYDIIGLAAYLPACGTKDNRTKADTIINYILNGYYQRLPLGRGVVRAENGYYFSMGWGVWLPGFFGALPGDIEPRPEISRILAAVVRRLVLMGQFPAAREHPWFINILNHLHGFQTEEGTYQFPSSYLREKPDSFWWKGACMGLEENRRKEFAFELESTFWMAKLKAAVSPAEKATNP